MENNILRKYTMTLMKCVLKKISNKEIYFGQLKDKLNIKSELLKTYLNGDLVTIETAIEICEAAGINIYEHIDKEKLDEALLDEYKSIYSKISDEDKLLTISLLENKSNESKNKRLYKTSNKFTNKLFDLIYNEKTITFNEIIEKTGYSPIVLMIILNGEGSIWSFRKICKVLGLNCNDYIDYDSIKNELNEGKTDLFKQIDLKSKFSVIELAFLCQVTNIKDTKEMINTYINKN